MAGQGLNTMLMKSPQYLLKAGVVVLEHSYGATYAQARLDPKTQQIVLGVFHDIRTEQLFPVELLKAAVGMYMMNEKLLAFTDDAVAQLAKICLNDVVRRLIESKVQDNGSFGREQVAATGSGSGSTGDDGAADEQAVPPAGGVSKPRQRAAKKSPRKRSTAGTAVQEKRPETPVRDGEGG